MHPRLSQLFTAAAGKDLAAVEIDSASSNQHELNGVSTLRVLLGDPGERRTFPTRFIFINDDLEVRENAGEVTWYDSRRNNPARSPEGRLYYSSPNPVMAAAEPGDGFILAARTDGSLMAIITPIGSSVGAQLRSLFDVEVRGTHFVVGANADEQALDLSDTATLEALGLEVDWTDTSFLEGLLATFGSTFPTTSVFSAYARAQCSGIDPRKDPDAALLHWMTTEEMLFRTLEKHLITESLERSGGDVDAVLDTAQRAFQRRRARAGQALENHIEELLDRFKISHTRGGRTEGRKKPDFIFPSIDAYHDPSWPEEHLMMLGAKRTCRDRWRQVLTEADRVPEKHLITLEAPISSYQLAEMQAEQLRLVVPRPLHRRFDPNDRWNLLTVSDAITRAASKASD